MHLPDAVAITHPAVATWFARRFPDGPTPAQAKAWPAIAAGENTLVAAPTGSGKTLAGFLVGIDRLYRAAERGEFPTDTTQVVYVSPLKALAFDIHENLQRPIAEIAEVARELGFDPPDITVGLRSGDTTRSARAALVKRPPNFLITTPESLYLMLTAARSRATLGTTEAVIVDEIHAVARDKSGSHLALTLERLAFVAAAPPQRIGLSATQRPIATVASLLVGAGSPCTIIDEGHSRPLDLAIELPGGELEAVMAAEQLSEVLDHIAGLVAEHRTTLIFVNTRRQAERIAHLLAEHFEHHGIDPSAVAAHHGSLSKDRRLRVEARLRSGELRALVATASLELGIDIGPINLVCQVGSPRSLATFLQRVGRSGHTVAGTPKGRLYPTTRDELVECVALLAGVRAGKLDALSPPVAPLDILAQQIVAECAALESKPDDNEIGASWSEDELFALMQRAAPYMDLEREAFDEIIEMLSDGIETGRGRRMAYLHRDRVNHVVRPRRGARLAALTSGGAIPEVADYRVVADPDDTFIGTVNEDWAIESMAGDVFLLGTTSWRIRRVESGVVRVIDAGGAPPTIPFWLGEAPARTWELSEEVSSLRVIVDRSLARIDDGCHVPDATTAVMERAQVTAEVAEQVVAYLGAARGALGVLPSHQDVVIERCFDETGGMQLILHAPFGGRINRGLGLALRKRFCVSFDFELQAAADDNSVLLSLGPQHSFPLADVPKFLSSKTVEEVLSQAVLASPMFAARWRWNLNRSLAVLRFRGGRKNPPPIQRMESDDFMAAIFPRLAACGENNVGPIEIPDHAIVRQTMYDCLHEAMDIDGLRELIEGFETGRVRLHFRDTTEPSPLAHEILNGRPFTFLDDAPLEERRSRALKLRRGLPVEERDLSRLDPDAIERVRREAQPDPRNPDELHELLCSLVVLPERSDWEGWLKALLGDGRALRFGVSSELGGGATSMWCAIEMRSLVEAAFPLAAFSPDNSIFLGTEVEIDGHDRAVNTILRGHLETLGPVTVGELSAACGFSHGDVAMGIARLEAEGFLLRGTFDVSVEVGASQVSPTEQVCARNLLARIHSYTAQRRRAEIEPVTAQDLMRFLLRWHNVAPGTQHHGRAGLLAVIEQLQGFELAVGAWESDVFAARVSGYRPEMLDALCLSGEVAWGRLAPRPPDPEDAPRRSGTSPSRATPIAFSIRGELPWLLAATRGTASPSEPTVGSAREILDALADGGALFSSELTPATGRLPIEVNEALWDGVARGLVSADGFGAVRSLFSARERWRSRQRAHRHGQRRGLRRGAVLSTGNEGRWSRFPAPAVLTAGAALDPDEVAEALAEQLLARWGVVFKDLVQREQIAIPWRDVLWALRRLEARGIARGGRFVTGFSGEQFALPEALEGLRRMRRTERRGELITICAADPLNLAGIILPGPRIPAVRTRQVTYCDGLLVAEPIAAGAG